MSENFFFKNFLTKKDCTEYHSVQTVKKIFRSLYITFLMQGPNKEYLLIFLIIKFFIYNSCISPTSKNVISVSATYT